MHEPFDDAKDIGQNEADADNCNCVCRGTKTGLTTEAEAAANVHDGVYLGVHNDIGSITGTKAD